MKSEEKDLLLRDLCARLPYGVEIQIIEWATLDTTLKTGHIARLLNNDAALKQIKPYLFPFSSMTDEQKRELDNLVEESVFQILHSEDGNPQPQIPMDWYNKNHFDYRGLIPKGLAIDATNLNIY